MLHELLAEAVALGGGDLCAAGHDWRHEGGRACPHKETVWGSQPVYRCARCGEYDYGEPDGPGHDDCVNGACGCDWHGEP